MSGASAPTRRGCATARPTRCCSAQPIAKAILQIDWTYYEYGATLSERYVSAVTEQNPVNRLDETYYTDLQFRWTPPRFKDRVELSVGMNNLFDEDPPGCFSCSLNNYDPGTYDAPGRFAYLRIAYKQ
jgi:iron complex outermembrane receptor protein